MKRFVQLTTEMTTTGVKCDLRDLNDRLLNALPTSWKQTVTLFKHTEKFPMDQDLLIAKIEEVEIDECPETMKEQHHRCCTSMLLILLAMLRMIS